MEISMAPFFVPFLPILSRPRFLLPSKSFCGLLLLPALSPERSKRTKAFHPFRSPMEGSAFPFHGISRPGLHFHDTPALVRLPNPCTEPAGQENAALRRLVPCHLPAPLNLCWRKWQATKRLRYLENTAITAGRKCHGGKNKTCFNGDPGKFGRI